MLKTRAIYILCITLCNLLAQNSFAATPVAADKQARKSSYEADLMAFRADDAIRHLCSPLNQSLRKGDYKLACKIMRCIALSFRLDENDRAATQAALIACQLDPENELAKFQAAEYLNRNGQQEESKKLFTELCKSKDEKLSLRSQAFLAHQTGYSGKAKELLEKYTEKYPDDQRALLRLCYLYQNIDDRASAAAVFTRLANLSPTEYLREIYLGRAAELEKKFNEAMDHYRKAGVALPSDPLWNFQLGSIFMKQQKMKEADYQFNQCFENKRLLSCAFTSWAVKESFFGSSKQAHRAVEYVQSLRPNASESYLVNGILFERENRAKDAIASFHKALQLNPHNSAVYQHLLETQEYADTTKRKELCEQWVSSCPNSGRAAIELANTIARENDKEATQKAYEFAEDLLRNRRTPSDPNFRIAICKMHAQLATLHYMKKETAEALEQAKLFNSIRPDAASNMGMRPPKMDLSKIKGKELKAAEHALLADTLSETRDLDAAEKEYREAIKQDPNDSMYHSCLLKVLIDKKDFSAAAAEDAKVSHQIVSHIGDLFKKKD